MPIEELFKEMARCASPGYYQMCVEELQRRFLVNIEVQVKNLTESSTRLEKLTEWLNGLTLALIVFTVVQLGIFIWDVFRKS